jgi:hypothetical protein
MVDWGLTSDPVNLILEKTDQVPFFTDMESVFHALKIPCQDYDWYLSDIETNYHPAGFSARDQLFEITCWDSSATILAGISPEAAANFLRAFPDTRPLSDHTRTVCKEK